MKRGAKARREALEHVLESQQRAVAASIARRNTLLLRQEVIGLMARCLAEVAEHKRRFGFDDGEERRQLEAFRSEAGLDPTAPNSGGSGGGGGRGGGSGAGGGSRLWELAHTGRGSSLLHLERVTREDVDFCRNVTFEEAAARFSAFLRAGSACLAKLRAGGCSATVPSLANSADATAPAAAAAAREFHGFVKFFNLLLVWQPDLHLRINTQSFVNGQELTGEADAPQALWDAIVRDAGLSMEQALLLLDARRLANARYARVWNERAALLAELSQLRAAQPGASAAASGPGFPDSTGHCLAAPCINGGQVSGGGGDGGTGSGGNGGGGVSGSASGGSSGSDSRGPQVAGDWGDARASELVEQLAAASRAERFIILYTSHTNNIILRPDQLAWAFCAAYPWPVHTIKCIQAIRHALVLDPRGAFPWAGPPVELELADLLRDLHSS